MATRIVMPSRDDGRKLMAFTISVPAHYEALGHVFAALLQRLDENMGNACDGAALDYATSDTW
jgi:hypothetical protein